MVVEAENTSQDIFIFLTYTQKYVFPEKISMKTLFSLHKMIAYMLPHIILKFEALVNFEKEITSIFLRNRIFYSFYVPAYLYITIIKY